VAAFVTLNHIQTIDEQVWRAEAACGRARQEVRHRALTPRVDLNVHLSPPPWFIAASLGCLVDLGEVTSLDVGLVALHQAQRYAVLQSAPRYFDDKRHQPRRSFIIRQPSRQQGRVSRKRCEGVSTQAC